MSNLTKYWIHIAIVFIFNPANIIFNQLIYDGSQETWPSGSIGSGNANKGTIMFAAASEHEEKLIRDLFRDYNKLIRPVLKSNESVRVEMGLSLVQLINVNEKNQVMTSNVWQQFVWHDYQFKWEPANYGGIEVLRLPPDKVWRPDIVLFNNADGNYEARYKSNVLISPDSTVEWIPPAIFQSTCRIDVTYFPFDQQRCEMTFGSWTYPGMAVTIDFYKKREYVELSDYLRSGTWDVVEVPACLENTTDGTQILDSKISFYITIRRKTLFYTVNLILPTVLISFLCILVFYLPAECGEKVTLGISILLSLVVFLLLVSKILPPTSLVIPLIAKYLLFTFVMNFLSVLVTVLNLNVNFRGPRTHTMPNWMRHVFLSYLPTLLRMKRPKKTRLRWMMDMHGSSPPCEHVAGVQNGNGPMGAANGDHLDGTSEFQSASLYNNIAVQLSPAAARATEAIEFIAEHLKCEDEYVQIREDWKYVAMTIDRLFLYVFSVCTAVGTLHIFFAAPHLFESIDQDKLVKLQGAGMQMDVS